MKTLNTRGLVAAALLGLTVAAAGCAGTATTKSTGDVVDDATIATKVKAKLIEDPVVKAMNIQVETFKGTVQLSGFASSQAEADRAVQLARETSGVRSVKNDIRLK
jgi:hyperosmotically inducible protein